MRLRTIKRPLGGRCCTSAQMGRGPGLLPTEQIELVPPSRLGARPGLEGGSYRSGSSARADRQPFDAQGGPRFHESQRT